MDGLFQQLEKSGLGCQWLASDVRRLYHLAIIHKVYNQGYNQDMRKYAEI